MKPSPDQSRNIPVPPKDLSYIEKEYFMVENISAADMLQFSSMPYDLHSPMKKVFGDNCHPFAYMDLDARNQVVAKAELERLNHIIVHTPGFSVSSSFLIDVDSVVFSEYNPHREYSTLRCTPYTFSGKVAKYPLWLHVLSRSDYSVDYPGVYDDIVGQLYYSPDGFLDNGHIHVWHVSPVSPRLIGYGYYFETIDGTLILYKVVSTDSPNPDGTPGIIYRCPHLIALDAERKKEAQDFAWLTINIPDRCPKSITGYRRMKSANSKNFQLLKRLAADLGRHI